MAYRKKKEVANYGALCRELREKGPERLYLLWGEEDYLVSDFTEKIRAACVPEGNEDFDLKLLEGPGLELRALEDALDAMPFFGGRTFVHLRGVDINKCTDERFRTLLGDVPEWCTVLVTLPPETAPDGRLGIVKLLKSKGKAVEFEARPEGELFRWLTKRFAAHGKRIGQREMERLLFLSGELMNRLIPEIDKVCAYAQGEEVTMADIDAVAHHLPEADAFEMADSIAAGDYDGAAALLSELLAKDTEPIWINAALSTQLRRLYAAKLSQERKLGAAWFGEVTGSKGYFASRAMETARGFSLEELRQDVRLCAETDWLLKGGSALEGTEILKELLLRLAMTREHAAH